MSHTDTQFDNVTVIKQANVYHDGKVTSRVVKFADGSHKTLGIMLPGEYTFGTEAAELMEITAGSLDVQLPGSDSWQRVEGGQSFDVPANASFNLKVHSLVDYCCSYFD
ncbi:pyrimidine/purine nucleoside phosphorylase [Oceanimonas smirnovii]|uniref:pyrimidine/purine nucleoside phosphorylase n=1 Tax=Oceanimonas smirnovii TaxID=264574 RepID=UPI003FD28BFA